MQIANKLQKGFVRFMRRLNFTISAAFLLSLLTALPARGQTPTWTTVGQIPPLAGAQAVVKDTLIYILGGYYDPGAIGASLSPMIFVYNPRLNRLDSLGVLMITGRAGFISGVHENSLYYVGGVWSLSGPPYAFSMERWDFTNPPAVYNFSPEFNRRNAAGLLHNGNMYLIGGQPAGNDTLPLSYIAEYNIGQASITYTEDSLFNAPPLPYHQMSANLGDDIYIFGGARFGISRRVYKFNALDHGFQEVSSLPRERAGGAAVAVNDQQIYIIGGYNENAFPSALDSVTIYTVNPSGGNSTEPGPSLNVSRRDLAAVRYMNSIYVFGGVDQFGFPVSWVEKLDISTALPEPPPAFAVDFELYPNYPNPFNSATTIEYRLGKAAHVRLEIYSVLGQPIAILADARQQPGIYRLRWDGRDRHGAPVSSGIYFYKLSSGDFTDVKKMILIQ